MDYDEKIATLISIMNDGNTEETGLAIIETLPAFLLANSGLDKEDAKRGMDAICEDIKDVIDEFDVRIFADA